MRRCNEQFTEWDDRYMLSYGCVLRFWRRDAGGVRMYLPKSSRFW